MAYAARPRPKRSRKTGEESNAVEEGIANVTVKIENLPPGEIDDKTTKVDEISFDGALRVVQNAFEQVGDVLSFMLSL